MEEPDVFDGLGEGPSGAAYATDDIEAALADAEALLGVGGAAGTAAEHQGGYGDSHFQQQQQQRQQWEREPSSGYTFVHGAASDSAATSEGCEAAPALPPRPPSAFSLGEAAMQLRLSLHEKQMELLHLRAQYTQLAELSQTMQQQLEEAVGERDGRIARLEEGWARREAAVERLTQQLQAYRGLAPEAAAALQADNAALATAKAAAEAAAADSQRRHAEAAQRVQQGVVTWEKVQAELQGQVRELTAALQRQQGEAADLYQDKEVLRARLAMLEARQGPLVPGGTFLGGPQAPAGATAAATAAAASAAEAVAAVTAQQELRELRRQLAEALERLEARQLSTSKYKEAVRALKRRVSELEGQLAAAQAAADAAARQARDAASGDAAKAAQAAAALQQAEQQLGAVREQCKEHARRRAEVDAQLATAEYERSQWEYRAKDAERRAQAAEEAAEAAGTAAARLAGRRQVQAEGRAADKEAEAKAASLRVLQLEKALAQARQELEALRQRQAQAPPPPQQQQQPADHRAREQAAALQQQVATLRQQLAAAQERQSSAEASLKGKAAALAASEKRLRQFEAAMHRLAAKQGGADSWRIGTDLAA